MRNWELDVEGRRKKEEGRRKKEEIAIRVPMTCSSCFGELPIANCQLVIGNY
ncbi:hypothetical protein NDI43_14180 [Microcoleus vaginatus GB2-A3]|uniref:hypothetical protein n=1 Tax=Microcoleus TaxID=44471 RepID=UPI001688D4C9|nr:hypothetical protein [Microcoleus sp. FACHB-DQ6]